MSMMFFAVKTCSGPACVQEIGRAIAAERYRCRRHWLLLGLRCTLVLTRQPRRGVFHGPSTFGSSSLLLGLNDTQSVRELTWRAGRAPQAPLARRAWRLRARRRQCMQATRQLCVSIVRLKHAPASASTSGTSASPGVSFALDALRAARTGCGRHVGCELGSQKLGSFGDTRARGRPQ